MNKTGESGHACPVRAFRGNILLCPIQYAIDTMLGSYGVLLAFTFNFFSAVILQVCSTLSKAFRLLLRLSSLKFTYTVHYVILFVYNEPALFAHNE